MTRLLENKTQEDGISYLHCLTGKEIGFNSVFLFCFVFLCFQREERSSILKPFRYYPTIDKQSEFLKILNEISWETISFLPCKVSFKCHHHYGMIWIEPCISYNSGSTKYLSKHPCLSLRCTISKLCNKDLWARIYCIYWGIMPGNQCKSRGVTQEREGGW